MGATDLISDRAPPTSAPSPAAGNSVRRVALANLPALPVLLAVAVMILWAAHNGGYDEDTWYWGALGLLAVLVLTVGAFGTGWTRWHRSLKLAFVAFTLYVAWSYLSITWASYKGDAVTGSNRALLYLIVFTLFAVVPWTPARARIVLLVYAIGVGVIGGLILEAMASAHNSGSLFSQGRLISPTGYFNSSAALFTSAAFVSVALAVRKELPALLRGLLLAIACAGLQLALLAESRGWLFTLPLVLVAAIAVAPARLRTIAAAILPTVGALVALPRLLDVFRAFGGFNPNQSAVIDAAKHAARPGLLICGAVFVVGTVFAALDGRVTGPTLSRWRVRLIGLLVAALAVGAGAAGGAVATHGHPVAFVKRQWNGFTHPSESFSSSSHFAVVGSGRYDAWRVALDALEAHPIGGLGQDNYADYYIVHRHTGEELQWTHSIEMRLLAHTGLVGFFLFVVFVLAALAAAIRNRNRGGALGAMAGIAVLPFVVWWIHGSVDWFWEMPALSGPALGFLAMAGALGGRVGTTSPGIAEPGAFTAAVPAAASLSPGREPRSDTAPGAEAEQAPEAEAEHASEAEAERASEAEAERAPQAEAEHAPEADTESDPAVEPEAAAGAPTDADATGTHEPSGGQETDSAPNAESEPGAAPESEPLAAAPAPAPRRTPRGRAVLRAIKLLVATVVLLAAVFALGFPYLSVREVSTASDLRATNPTAALNDLTDAARLDPFSADPGRLGGAIALQASEFTEAEKRFKQAISREPGGWFSWLGAGLAASSLGKARQAHHDFAVAESINSQQPAIAEALKLVYTKDPLTPAQAFQMLQVVQ